jgi:hypothetical protein
MTNPDIYCVNMTLRVIFPSKSKYKAPEVRKIHLDKIPVLLLNKELPQKEKDKLYIKVFDEYIHKGDFSKYKFVIDNMEIVKFLSKICYKYSF